MKILICGDRDYKDDYGILKAIVAGYVKTEDFHLIEGEAPGADQLSKEYFVIWDGSPDKLSKIPAEWDRFGRGAGPIRNRAMADLQPDMIIAFHDYLEASIGTKDMTEVGLERGIPTYHVRRLR